MSVFAHLTSGTLKRELRTRGAANAHRLAHRARARIPRYRPSEHAKEFHSRAEQRGLADTRLLYWYHTIDLGEGLVTPGTFDYRASIANFHFPADMSGMSVLDVGSATGFFAFEFERRGANVVSVDLPSLAEVDRLPGESVEEIRSKLARITYPHSTYTADAFDRVFNRASVEDFYHYFFDGPFKLCHHSLGSRVERTYSSIYGIPDTELGSRSFDLVFLGDVLLHLLHPFKALAAVAPLCRGTLVLSQHLPVRPRSRPEVLYVGGDTPGEDRVIWWLPNRACFDQILRKLGFRDVDEVGRNVGVGLGGMYYDRPVLHARR